MIVAGNKFDPKKYNIIYYLHFDLYKKNPIKHSKLYASITSHKCLDRYKETVKKIRNFNKVSVNNNILFNIFSKNIKVYYLPNGVDINFFTPSYKGFNPKNILIGWVGNVDRKTKNYQEIVKPLAKRTQDNVCIKTIKTSKSKPYIFNLREMRTFYNSLDFFLVSSNTEGTPNPALEAASCGLPLISTRVGNMPDLIVDRENGFFVNPVLSEFQKVIKKISLISCSEYYDLHNCMLERIKNWSWDNCIIAYRKFFDE
jgi:glycosyltransferase involved in cell wall biosynthesis